MMILRYIESLLVRQINWLRVLNRETGFISQGSTAAGPPPSHSSGCDSWRSRSCAAGICMLHSCIIQGVPSSQTWQRRLHVNTCHLLQQTLFQAGENQSQWPTKPLDSRWTWQSMAPFGWAVQSCAKLCTFVWFFDGCVFARRSQLLLFAGTSRRWDVT